MYSLDQVLTIYESVGHRDSHLFRWLYDHLYTKLRLSSVPSDFSEDLRLLKTKSAVFITMVDDVADNQNYRDQTLLSSLIDIPFKRESDSIGSDYYNAALEIWHDILCTIEQYPRYSEFRDIFNFDLRLVMTSQEYSVMINTDHSAANIVENEIYGPHGTLVVAHGTVDLMCSPKFDNKELGSLREILLIAQKIAQLCNMINTYAREIDEEDISSPIIMNALLENPDTNLSDLINEKYEMFKQLEEEFEKTVHDHLDEMREFSDDIKTIDVTNFADTMHEIWEDYKVRTPFS